MTRRILSSAASAAPAGLSAAAALLALVAASSGTARAETQAELAARENEEGKQLMYADKFSEAAKKFAQASARVPEVKYFLNLCTARLNEGQLSLALTACNAAEVNSPSAEQKDRAEKLISRINEEAKKQNVKIEPVGGGGGDQNRPPDPGNPPPPGAPPPTVVAPLQQNLVVAGPPEHRYTWTLGVDFFAGGGRVGQQGFYGSALAGVRFKGDYLISPAARIGGEIYGQISSLGASSADLANGTNLGNLNIYDLGVAAYKHFCPGGTPRLCFTPLLGLQLSFMSPDGEMDVDGNTVFNFASVGARADLSLDVAFGRRYEHVFSVMLGGNFYSPALSGPSQAEIEDVGLDVAGAAGYVGIGYTYRFNTPLGATPFIVLE